MYKILIIEDEHLIRKWLSYAIDYSTYGAIIIGEASDGEEGIKKIHQLEPDIVITDITMPKKNAFQMFEETKDIPYKKIILSGYSDFENAKKAIHYGVFDFISKPIDENELLESIKNLTNIIKQEQEQNKTVFFSQKVMGNLRETNDKVTNEVINWIHQYYDKKFTFKIMARDLGYSESFLYKKIKDHLGVTVNEYTNRFRINQAMKMMIDDPALKIYEIAASVGFSDYRYFNKRFKKYVGMSVTRFKESIRGVK